MTCCKHKQRRTFLRRCLNIGLLCLLVRPDVIRAAEKRKARTIRLRHKSTLQNGNNFFPIERVNVQLDGKSLKALSLTCTHQPCGLELQRDQYHCSCHGSRFDKSGKVLRGPARSDLPWYRLSLDEQGYLFVHFDEPVSKNWSLSIS